MVKTRHASASSSWSDSPASLLALAKGWRDDPEVLRLLRDRAVNDENEYPRRTTLSELAKGWANDAEVQKFVQEQRSKS